jgi:hypothetical protein
MSDVGLLDPAMVGLSSLDLISLGGATAGGG